MIKPVAKNKVNPMEVLKKRSLVNTLSEELESKGVKFLTPEPQGGLHIDPDYLAVPEDTTDVSSRELGRYLNALTQQKIYMRTMYGWQSIEVEECKREYYLASSPIYSELCKDKKLSETAKDKLMNNHPKVLPSLLNLRDSKIKLSLFQASLDSTTDAIFNISREISRRSSDFEDESRNESVSRK